jgi:hypothetical protein
MKSFNKVLALLVLAGMGSAQATHFDPGSDPYARKEGPRPVSVTLAFDVSDPIVELRYQAFLDYLRNYKAFREFPLSASAFPGHSESEGLAGSTFAGVIRDIFFQIRVVGKSEIPAADIFERSTGEDGDDTFIWISEGRLALRAAALLEALMKAAIEPYLLSGRS